MFTSSGRSATLLTRSFCNAASIMRRLSKVTTSNESGSASQIETPTLQKTPQEKRSTLKVDITKARRVRETETHLPLSWSPRLPSRLARELALTVAVIVPLAMSSLDGQRSRLSHDRARRPQVPDVARTGAPQWSVPRTPASNPSNRSMENWCDLPVAGEVVNHEICDFHRCLVGAIARSPNNQQLIHLQLHPLHKMAKSPHPGGSKRDRNIKMESGHFSITLFIPRASGTAVMGKY